MPLTARRIGRPTGAAALALALWTGAVRPAEVAPPGAIPYEAVPSEAVPFQAAAPTVAPRAWAGFAPGSVPVPVPAEPATDGSVTGGSSAEGEAPGPAARLALGPDGRDLRLDGDLIEGVAARVAALLAANPRVERIHLTSDGGLVDEASRLGALVAARGLSTYVPDACASACTLVFARGRRRYLAVGARLGFHAPYVVGPRGRPRAVDPAPERAAYRAAGLPRGFVARVLAVPPAGLWIPDAARLRAAGAVTAVVGRDRFSDAGPPERPRRDPARPVHPAGGDAADGGGPGTAAALGSTAPGAFAPPAAVEP